ncbi:MAG TPA: hypothetical protein VEO94_04460 [Candidatus Dormibacteraeota bacterium]|nr:hypothetical protein [Candidatus Dormibacteraeota bacterium]
MAEVPGPQEKRAAILVIHGIGEQRPYEALDAFVQGLARRLRVAPGTMQHRLKWRDGRAESLIRMPLAAPLNDTGALAIDLHEHYWAAEVERRIGLRRVLAWVVRTSLTPLRSWTTNPRLLEQERWHSRLLLVLREFARAVGLILFAVLILFPFLWACLQERAAGSPGAPRTQGVVGASLAAAWGVLARAPHPLLLILWAAMIALAIAQVANWRGLLKGAARDQASLARGSYPLWRRATLALAAALLAGAWALDARRGLGVGELARGLAGALGNLPTLAVLADVVAIAALRRFLVKYLGDVALYVNEDERAFSFRTRDAILKTTQRHLRALLLDPQYAAVYVAGHSLGSVIAYDTIGLAVREMRADPGAAETAGRSGGPDRLTRAGFDRLRGLLTFGSPLDKIQYFFRTDVRDTQAIRAQILSSLHGFRRKASGREYGDMRLARYRLPSPPRFRWLNVFSFADPVSGRLDYFTVDEQAQLWLFPWPTAHLRYWTDPRFYEHVVTWLRSNH